MRKLSVGVSFGENGKIIEMVVFIFVSFYGMPLTVKRLTHAWAGEGQMKSTCFIKISEFSELLSF
jgi:hypothetical protein